MFDPRVYDERVYTPRMTDRNLNNFAKSLYGYLYSKLNITYSNRYKSPHFKDVIGCVVLCIRNSIRDFNIAFLDKCGFCASKQSLCQQICDLYPNTDYFKKFFFISAFILELVSWWNEGEVLKDYSLGPNLWQTMFRKNFESEFENRGGWEGLLKAATGFHEMPPNEILFREHFLPATLEGVISSIRGLYSSPVQAAVDEATASLEKLRVGQVEIDDASNVEAAQSEEGSEENQPGKEAQVQESKEEDQPEVMDDRPGPSGIGGNVVETETLGESSSGKSGEDVLHRLGGKNLLKRKLDAPSKTDSGEESDSRSLAKAKKGQSALHSCGGRNLLKRKFDTHPKSHSDEESDSLSPSKSKFEKK